MKHLRGHYMLAIFAVTVMILVGSIYAYMSYSVSESITKSASLRESLRASNANQEKEKAFLEKFEKTEQDWSRLPEFFVPSDNVVRFIEAVESLGQSVGSTVTLSSIEADNMENAKNGTIGSIRAHVDAQGPWSAVMRTLRLAEVLPYKVTLNNVRVDVSDGTDKSAKKIWHLAFDIKSAMLYSNSAATSSDKVTSPTLK